MPPSEYPVATADGDDAPAREAVVALAVSPTYAGDRTLFAATMAGLYRSQDAGRRWKRLEIVSPDLPLLAVAVSPAFAEDGLLFAGPVEGGLLRGTEGGAKWSVAAFAQGRPCCTALALSPDFRRDGLAFAGTMSDGIFQSQNRGTSWETRTFGLLDLEVLTLALSPDFAHDETAYAATVSGLYRSRNGGRAWRESPWPLTGAPVQCLALSPEFSEDGILFAGTDGTGILCSHDRGATWETTALAEACINGVALSPAFARDRTVLAITGDALYVSFDAGTRWEQCANLPDALCLTVTPAFPGDGGVFVGCTRQGILRCTDLHHWEILPVV